MNGVILAKLLDLVVLLNCQQQEIMALPIDSKKTAVSVGRAARDKIDCVVNENKKPIKIGKDFLATPHQSFDMGFMHLPLQPKAFFKLTKNPPQIGAKVFSLKALSENRTFQLSSAGLVETCEHTKKGLQQLVALPAEERATHPDQDYGLRLWHRYCQFKAEKNSYTIVGQWHQYEIVSGKVLWADDKTFISSLPLGPAGAPVLNEAGDLVGMQTALTPFKEPVESSVALSVSKTLTSSTRKIVQEAKKNGLWDY